MQNSRFRLKGSLGRFDPIHHNKNQPFDKQLQG